IVDSSVISPILSDAFAQAGIADDVRISLSAAQKISQTGGKLDALDLADKMNLYLGKSFGKMYLGYNMEFMKDVSKLDLRYGFEVMYRMRGGNILKAIYRPDEGGQGERYLGIEKRIRF
ncbi:MAG: hypothetical protein J7L54_00845, partial [Elusimicrobia bacterium]|nr:hypothetical protein [Elusimicrobiota bacterium]